MTKTQRKQGKSRLLDKGEVKRVLRYQKGNQTHGIRNTCLLMMSCYLGMRVGEMSCLKISDIVCNDGTLKDTLVLRKEYTKGKKTRTLYLVHKEVRKSLNDYLSYRKEKEGTLNIDSSLFRSQKGDGFNPRTLQMLFKSMYRKVGLDEMVSSHSGRRTFGTNLILQGIDIKTVSTLMGHSSVQTTIDVYCVPNPKIMEDVSRNLKLM
jgi:integrase/recombinase XerD